jgi:RNA polymerase sigma-70 factor (ECF subfamily)
LLQLASKLQTFAYDPARRVRAWLKTLTHHAWSDFLALRSAEKWSGDSGLRQLLDRVPARDELTECLPATFDRELLNLATGRVRARVEERTWDAYWLTALEGLSGAQAAARLGMQVGTGYKAKIKFHMLLQDTLRQMQEEEVA